MNKKRLFSVVLAAVFALSLIGCNEKGNQGQSDRDPVNLNLTQMQSVCELATLECYYHNTAKLESEKEVLWWSTSKKLWIEYSGTVKVGIDISKLDMHVKDNIVTIAMPDAKILSCQIDDSSLSEDSFYSETRGLGSGKVDAEDQTRAFQAAQEGMLATVQEDELLLHQAKVRAQTLLEKYVKYIGDAIGIEYEIHWKTIEGDDIADGED
ncbi:MAG: DUF4230 domain-containing protein [Lachnospiraceae bacterium]|nr:DUF4230 domain-containing protein [Lachnospiraceae bacterium]